MRKPRILEQGARYHVSARAQRQEMIMDSDAMKSMFLSVVARAKEKYDFRIENFCVMGNHFHFIIQPINGASLSRIMQWIMGVFAMTWNRLRGLSGHVWGQRFFSRVLRGIADFLTVFQYIDLNPVTAGLVKNPGDWVFGGTWFRQNGEKGVLDEIRNL
jgi:putative transposase